MDCFHEDYDARGIFFCCENNMKNPDKKLSGKSDEIEVNFCKNQFFTLHSSFFILRELSSRTAKG